MPGVFLFYSLHAQQSSASLEFIQKLLVNLEEARLETDARGYEMAFLKLINQPVNGKRERDEKTKGILNELNALRTNEDPWIRFNYILHCLQQYPLGEEERDFLHSLLHKGQGELRSTQGLDPKMRIYYSLAMSFDYVNWRKRNGFYQEAIDTMERIKNRLTQLTEEEAWHPHTETLLLKCYNSLGGLYADLGMFPIAIAYNDLYLELIKDSPNPWDKVLALGRKGNYLFSMGDTAQSLPILEETVQICAREYPKVLAYAAKQGVVQSNNYRRYTSRLKTAYRDLASVYMAQGKMKLAGEMLRVVEAIPILHNEDALLEALHRADYLAQTDHVQQAAQILNKALSAAYDSFHAGQESVEVGTKFSLRVVMNAGLKLSRFQQLSGDLRSAGLTLDQLEKELKKLSATVRVEWINLDIERVRLQLLSYRLQPDADAFNHVLKKVMQTKAMILDYQATTTDDESKLVLNKAGRELFGLGLTVAMLMPEGVSREEVALQHAEAGRAVLLDQALRLQRTNQFPGIPDSLQDQMKQLTALIEGYELQMSLHSVISRNNQSDLTRLREDKRRLAIRLKKEYPDRYRESMVRQLPRLSTLQSKLPKGAGILSFALHDTLIFAQLITRAKSESKQIPVPDDFIKGVLRFLQVLKSSRNSDCNSPDGQDFSMLARAYYRLLFEPFETHLPERLLIVPDGPIAFIPFDCLLTDDPPATTTWDNLPYQIRKRALSVHFSMGSWLQEEQKPIPDFKFNWAGFAPDFPIPLASNINRDADRDILVKLLYNKQEVLQVGEIFQGQYFLDQQANLAAFRKVAGQSAILHLSTHAKANDRRGDQCFIAFANASGADHPDPGDTLRAAEIYSMRIPAELLILSACETGVGEVKDGEGMIGLHHAFTQAGVRSILSTLWTVDDRSMIALMVPFATCLAEGMTKDQALQSAKLQFLTQHPKQGHPFYWSALTLQGSLQPLHQSGKWWLWAGLALLLLGLIMTRGIWLFRKGK